MKKEEDWEVEARWVWRPVWRKWESLWKKDQAGSYESRLKVFNRIFDGLRPAGKTTFPSFLKLELRHSMEWYGSSNESYNEFHQAWERLKSKENDIRTREEAQRAEYRAREETGRAKRQGPEGDEVKDHSLTVKRLKT